MPNNDSKPVDLGPDEEPGLLRRFWGRFDSSDELYFEVWKRWENLLNPFHQTVYRVKKYCGYARVLWNDHDFDLLYVLPVLRYKLTRLAFVIENGSTEREARQAQLDKIKVVTDAILRWLDDQYGNARYKELLEKVHYDVDHEGFFRDMGTLTKEERSELDLLRDQGLAERERDWALIWDTIKDHGQAWWD